MACKESVKIRLKSIPQLTKWGGAKVIFMFDEEGEGPFEDYEEIDVDGKKVDEEENLFEEGMYESEDEEEKDDEEEVDTFADYDDDDDATIEGGDDF